MRRVPNRGRRWLSRFIAPACASLGLCGCAGWWDEVRSRDFSFKNLFKSDNPYVVLQESTDGDKRAKALRALPMPTAEEDAKERETVLKILETTAVEDRLALCRLAAIQKLGEVQDPRAAPALVKAFYAARASKMFTSETVNIIECHALAALGQTKQPGAVEHLVLVVREPPVTADASQEDKQFALDRRTAAARALGNFKNYQATDALVQVLRTENNVALRDRAHESLQLATGKKLPPEPKAWEALLHGGGEAEQEKKSPEHVLTGFRPEPKPPTEPQPPAEPTKDKPPVADTGKKPLGSLVGLFRPEPKKSDEPAAPAEDKPATEKKPAPPPRGLLMLNNNLRQGLPPDPGPELYGTQK